jgi:hypothetical protein
LQPQPPSLITLSSLQWTNDQDGVAKQLDRMDSEGLFL